jgi:NAD(P)-dependent dehydrogenase (short-subunit alcohol dehydrogenase family)
VCAPFGTPAVFHETDVRDPAACRSAVDRAVEAFGRVDCLTKSIFNHFPGRTWD